MADGGNGGKRASLLMMNFSVNEVEFAIDKLGMLILSKRSLLLIMVNFKLHSIPKA